MDDIEPGLRKVFTELYGALLQELPPLQMLLLVLAYQGDMSLNRASRCLGVPYATAWGMHGAALARLQRLIESRPPLRAIFQQYQELLRPAAARCRGRPDADAPPLPRGVAEWLGDVLQCLPPLEMLLAVLVFVGGMDPAEATDRLALEGEDAHRLLATALARLQGFFGEDPYLRALLSEAEPT